MKKLFTLALVGIALAGCGRNAQNKITMLPYPETLRGDVVENYHGTSVADPYRWLEDADSAETAAWVVAENEVTFNYLSQIPFRDAVKKRLTELWNYPKTGVPTKAGDYYFIFRNDGLQNQSVLYRQKGLDGTPELFLDPNTLSEDGTMALVDVSFSRDGRRMAYAVAAAGSDWVKIHIRNIETGRDEDTVEWVKFSGAVWAPDSKGFYYSCYEAPKGGNIYSAQNQHQMVYYHALGTPQSADVRIYRDDAHPLRYLHGHPSYDGKYLFVSASEGTHGTELLYRAAGEHTFRTLFPGFKYDYYVVHAEGDTAWVYTNDGAPNFRLAKIDLTDPASGLVDVIGEDPEFKLENVSAVGGYFMASYLIHAVNRVVQTDMNGGRVHDVEFDTLGTATGFGGDEKDATETFYALSTYTAPTTIYRYDLSSGASTLYDRPEVSFSPDDYTTEQVFFKSKDGTEVPMFIVHKKGIELNGKNPTYLYGYGGFNISLTPGFSPSGIMFMEQGGVMVDVNLRGGGEYGERWHEGGMLASKQNVFDDFIAAAEWLIANRYTSPEKLAIAGGSNGGLLVGAAMTQRPDLFAVALPAVGVMDMLRFHKFTVGWGWAVEYGSSDDAGQFEYIYKYSPLHNLRPGTCYPATLVTTADHDDRVVPAHSFKFAAELQHDQACENPVLIRIETNAGHGAGKPTSKRIDEATDVYSFIFQNTNTKVEF